MSQIKKNLHDVVDYMFLRLELNRNILTTWKTIRSYHVNENLETFWQMCIRLETDGKGEILHDDEPNKETLKLVFLELFPSKL